ncbi:Bacterial regulatory proteins, luxR family [Falsiruegeria litorea R37]|uniref:Bacterial regulatory proteins, luxR family n=1 Tax=Falsiruegeria litorea R37 TaxID=1200284 RepID=A0A1Y5TCJ0_9RHOB|nr:helix-turn-helix transcriptional regulator [Falsiruegeria litorea]SLN60604.1 Bacterial regulatory proteins, luxR family [Falsiruegeria litorea R37]
MKNSGKVWLWLLLVVQAVCAAFFVVDGLFDWTGRPEPLGFRHLHAFELLLSFALFAGIAVTAMHIRTFGQREAQMQRQLDMASGAFEQLIQEHFDQWQLSKAEREVAMLALKGLSVADIAALRQTKEGTIKAQCGAVYRKAGVSGRMQLLSYFVEELIAEPVLDRSPQT